MSKNKKLIIESLDLINDIGISLSYCLDRDSVYGIEKELIQKKLAGIYDLISNLETEKIELNASETDNQVDVNAQPDKKMEGVTKDEVENNDDNEVFELDADNPEEKKKEAIKEKIIEETKQELNKKLSSSNLNDSFDKKDMSSLHDELSRKFQKADLSSKLQSKPITDIHKAINLNDQFTFIKDIFKGDTDKYKSTIDVLNSLPNFNEAFNYLKSSIEIDINSASVQNLLNLVRRKYISNNNE